MEKSNGWQRNQKGGPSPSYVEASLVEWDPRSKQPSHPDCLLVSHITHDIPMIKSANHGMMCDPKISKLIQVHPKSSKMTCHGLKWLRIQRKIPGSGGHCLRQAHGSRPSSTSFSPWRGSAMKKEGRAAQ